MYSRFFAFDIEISLTKLICVDRQQHRSIKVFLCHFMDKYITITAHSTSQKEAKQNIVNNFPVHHEMLLPEKNSI